VQRKIFTKISDFLHKFADLCNFFTLFLKKVANFASEKGSFFNQKRLRYFWKRLGNFCKRLVFEKKSPKTPSKNLRIWAQKKLLPKIFHFRALTNL